MAVRKFKPTTPGQRHKVIGVFKGTITATTPEKSLTVGKRSTGGRNAAGHLTTRYRGGGHKRKLRLIDFKRNKDGVPAVVKSIEYDPNRSARIALLYYTDGEKAYMIAQNPRRYTHPLYRASSRSGRLYGSLSRYIRSTHFP